MKQQMPYPIPSNEMKRWGLPKQRFSQIRTKKSGISYRKYQKFFLTLREQVISILLLYPWRTTPTYTNLSNGTLASRRFATIRKRLFVAWWRGMTSLCWCLLVEENQYATNFQHYSWMVWLSLCLHSSHWWKIKWMQWDKQEQIIVWRTISMRHWRNKRLSR